MRSNFFRLGIVGLLVCFLVGINGLFATSADSSAAQYNLEVQPGVSSQMISDTELAIQTTVDFCTDRFGFSLSQPVAVLIVSDRAHYQSELQELFGIDELSAARWARTTDAVSGTNKMIRNGSSATSDSDRIFLVSHEMVHQYQRQIGFPSQGVWLVEGMADAVATHVTEQLGRRNVHEYEEKWHGLLAGAKARPSLAELSTRSGWSQALQTYGTQITYRTAALTVLQLWDDYGFDKVIELYRLSAKLGVNTAFEQVFGFPLANFQLRLDLEKAS